MVVGFSSFSCRKITLKDTSISPSHGEDWALAGGKPTRVSFLEQTVAPPLKHLWTYKASAAIGPTMVAVDGALYLSTLNGRIEAVDIVTGERFGSTNTQTTYAAACAYFSKHLVLASRYGDKTLAKYDLKRGRYVWEIDAGDIASEPLVTPNAVYVSALYSHIDRYDLATGERVWTFKTEDQHRSSPALHLNSLVTGCDNGTLYAVDADSGGLNWQMKAGASFFATPVIWEESVFIGSADSIFYAIKLKDGQVEWTFSAQAPLYQAAATDGSVVLFGASNGLFYCLDGATGEEKWRFQAKGGISTAPLIAGEVVYFGSLDRRYYCLRLDDGEELWNFEARGRVRTAPIIWNQYVIGASEDRYVYAFAPAESVSFE